jgi:hypothetical protein
VAVIAYQVDGAAAAVGIGRGAAVEVVIHGSTVLGGVAAQARAEGTRGRQPGRWVVPGGAGRGEGKTPKLLAAAAVYCDGLIYGLGCRNTILLFRRPFIHGRGGEEKF